MPTTDCRILSFPSPAPSAANDSEDALLGPSEAIARVWSQIRRIAPHFRSASIAGEAGTGAEAAARALHALSPVSGLPFHVVDAAAAEHILRSSTPAPRFSEGLLFFPEVERLSPEAQRALLRRLRVRARPLRVVATSATDLRAAVSAGQFHAELAEALTAIRITLPALRERPEDLPLLAGNLLHRSASALGMATPVLTDSFLEAAAGFEFQGNLTQLAGVMDYLLTRISTTTLTAGDFHAATEALAAAPQPAEPSPTRMVRLEEIVQEHIRAVLVACHGNKLRAAEVLGISRSTLYRMLDTTAMTLPIAV